MMIMHEAGFMKPSRLIFKQAIAELGLPARSILHVGDSRREGVQGERSAGLRPMLISRRAPRSKNEIGTLCELADLLFEIRHLKALNKPK